MLLRIVAAQPRAARGAYAIRVAERRAATTADRNLRDAQTLRYEAMRLVEARRYDDALPLAQQALTLV